MLGHNFTVEIALRNNLMLTGPVGFGENQRVVGGAVDFPCEHISQPLEGFVNGTVDLGGATERIGVLNPVARGVVLEYFRTAEQRTKAFSDPLLSRMGACVVNLRSGRRKAARPSVHGHGQNDIGQQQDAGQFLLSEDCISRHLTGAVDQRQPVLGREFDGDQTVAEQEVSG